MDKTIDEQTEFLDAIEFDYDQEERMLNIAEWANGDPERAARYILWLETMLKEY